MRMFTAVVPPEDVLEELEEFLGPRRDAVGDTAPLRWTRPEGWHLTLSFMGAVPDRALDDLLERLTRAGRRRTPFELTLTGGGAFPNIGRAKLLFARVDGATRDLEELSGLATGARAAATKAGAPVDGATFRPHLTLARMGMPLEATRWIRVLDGYRSRPFTVDAFTLVRSFLGEGPGRRPRYETVETFALSGNRAATSR